MINIISNFGFDTRPAHVCLQVKIRSVCEEEFFGDATAFFGSGSECFVFNSFRTPCLKALFDAWGAIETECSINSSWEDMRSGVAP